MRGLKGALRETLRGPERKNETKGLKGVIKESLKAGP